MMKKISIIFLAAFLVVFMCSCNGNSAIENESTLSSTSKQNFVSSVNMNNIEEDIEVVTKIPVETSKREEVTYKLYEIDESKEILMADGDELIITYNPSENAIYEYSVHEKEPSIHKNLIPEDSEFNGVSSLGYVFSAYNHPEYLGKDIYIIPFSLEKSFLVYKNAWVVTSQFYYDEEYPAQPLVQEDEGKGLFAILDLNGISADAWEASVPIYLSEENV